MSNIYDDEKAKTNAGARKSQVWRTIWAIVFVVLSVEAILIAALINSRRAVHVTRPIISVLPGGAPKIDQSTVGKYLKESWIYEDVTLRFYGEGAVALNPGQYLDSIKADYEFIAKFAGLRDVKLPSTIYLFGNELSGALAHSGLGAGWVEGETLYLPAGRSSAKPLLEYACAKAGSSPDGALLAGVAPFLGEFLDFYNDHPYETAFERKLSKWQRDTQLALPMAQVLLDDQRLGPDFISLPARAPVLIDSESADSEILRRGFYRFLLAKSGWDGFARLIMSGKSGSEAFEEAFGQPLPDLLKAYQESLDLMQHDAFAITLAKLELLDMGLFKYTPAAQVIADSEWAMKEESKRFRLPERDLAERQAALGNLHLRKFFAAFDPNSQEAKRHLSDAQAILLSPRSITDELDEIEHKWRLGKAHESTGDYETADRFFAAGLGNKDTRGNFLGEYSEILVERRNFQHASDILGEFLTGNQSNLRALYLRMSTLNRIGNHGAAAAYAEKIIGHPLVELGFYKDWQAVAAYIMQSSSIAQPQSAEANDGGKAADADD